MAQLGQIILEPTLGRVADVVRQMQGQHPARA